MASSRKLRLPRRLPQMAGLDASQPTAPPGDLGKHDPSFDISKPEAYRRDVPEAEVHVLDAGHFALDTTPDEIATLIRNFLGKSRQSGIATGQRFPLGRLPKRARPAAFRQSVYANERYGSASHTFRIAISVRPFGCSNQRRPASDKSGERIIENNIVLLRAARKRAHNLQPLKGSSVRGQSRDTIRRQDTAQSDQAAVGMITA
jgi:hypothetical protein